MTFQLINGIDLAFTYWHSLLFKIRNNKKIKIAKPLKKCKNFYFKYWLYVFNIDV